MTKEVDVIIHLILHRSYVAIHIQQGIFAIASGILLAKFHFDFSLSYKNLYLEIRTPWRCSIIIFSPLQLPSSMPFKDAHQIWFSFSSCLVMGNLEFPFWINRELKFTQILSYGEWCVTISPYEKFFIINACETCISSTTNKVMHLPRRKDMLEFVLMMVLTICSTKCFKGTSPIMNLRELVILNFNGIWLCNFCCWTFNILNIAHFLKNS